MGLSENLFRENKKIESTEYNSYVIHLISDLKSITLNFKAYVFGSVARNDATENSDLDLLFVISNNENIAEVKKKFYEIKTKIHFECDIIFQTEAKFLDANNALVSNISSEMKEVYPNWNLN